MVTTVGVGLSRRLNGRETLLYPGLDWLKNVSPGIPATHFSASTRAAEAPEVAEASTPSKR